MTGSLDLLRVAPIPASTPFIGTDLSGQFLIGAAYIGNLVWAGRAEPDGRVSTQPFEVVERIITPHSVLVHPNNQFVYVAATGHDEILTFQFDEATGKLTRTGNAGEKAIEGATPRHIALHPNMQFLFCMNESSGIIDSFRLDPADGSLALEDSVDPRPADHREEHGIGADLHLSADGRFLYGSERARSTISVHAVDARTGKLTFVESVQAGIIPRSFAIDPSGRFLIAAGQGSDDLTVFAIDPASGRLSQISSLETGGGPIWVEIVEPGRRRL